MSLFDCLSICVSVCFCLSLSPQSVSQSIDQLISQLEQTHPFRCQPLDRHSVIPSVNLRQSVNHFLSELDSHSIIPSVHWTVSQSFLQSVRQSLNHSFSQLDSHSFNHLDNNSTIPSVGLSVCLPDIHLLVNQSVKVEIQCKSSNQ